MRMKIKRLVCWIKSHWVFLLILFAIALLIGNICVLLFVDSENVRSEWLTLFSGWVSGIATLLVGIVAYWQSRKFDRISRKQNMVNQITNYISEFHTSFLQYIHIEKIIDLNHQMRQCYLETNETKKFEMAININDQIIYMLKSTLMFRAVLQKGNYCSNRIIEMHKSLEELSNAFKFSIHEINGSIDEHLEQCQKRSEWISQWMGKVNKLASSIMVEYHNLRANFMNQDNVDELIAQTEVESQTLIDYFNNVSEEYINM